jgi:hypothetical protein
MIKIVGKGYKYFFKQLDDFWGIIKQTVISLKRADGQKQYKEYFGRKPREKKIPQKIRILSIFQTRLSDYLTRKTLSVRKCQNIVCGNQQILFKEPDKVQIKKQHKNRAIHVLQTRLTDFIDGAIAFIKRKIKLPYKTKPVQADNEKYMESVIPDNQIVAFREYATFRGYLSNLFALNPSLDVFFKDMQSKYGYKPQESHDFLRFNNVLRLEIARCKLGFEHFNAWVAEFNQNESLRQELGIQSQHQLSMSSYQRNLNIISSALSEYANQLKQECRDFNLIGDKIWIWDRRFFECNCNGVKDKETGKLSDPDAGHYVKKTGKYSVLTGTGYTDTGFVDRSWGLPVYWNAIGANKNDNTIFKSTVIEGMNSYQTKPTFIISDAGPDSHESNKLVLDYGIIPVIAARSNSVGDIIKTDEGDCFRGEYIPREYHRILGKIYDLRTIIERKNSNEVVGYNRSLMPTRGIDWAKCFVSISNITALLTALTAYKVGRYDLIRAPGAFKKLSV